MHPRHKISAIKFIGLISVVLLGLLANSCHKCEILDQTITHPPIDTVATCEGVFYINQAAPGIDLNFFFNEFSKPIPDPFALRPARGQIR